MQKNTSSSRPKIIRKEGSEEIQRWELPNVEDMQTFTDSDGRVLTASPMTAEQLDRIQREAYQEAYDEGLAKGYNDGKQSATQQLSQVMEAVLNRSARPLQQLDREVEEQLVQLVMAVTRQLVRREIKTEPGEIVAVVREAMQMLPVSAREVQLFLHPEDVQIIKQVLSDGDNHTYWKLNSDPTLERGGCRIQTESSSIDATVERRLTSVIANMLGGEREQDATAPNADPA